MTEQKEEKRILREALEATNYMVETPGNGLNDCKCTTNEFCLLHEQIKRNKEALERTNK